MAGKTLYELLQAAFGLHSTSKESSETFMVDTVVTKIVSYNPNRLGLVMVNNGSATVYIKPNNQVFVGVGIRLMPNGGSVSLIWDEDFEDVASEWYGIADAGPSLLYYKELVAY